MSGGSLNYLYCKDPEELFDESSIDYLEKAEQYLLKNDAVDIAKDVRRLIEYVLSAKNRIEVMQKNLREVFKAIEWCQSGDSGKDRVDRTIAAYREDRLQNIIESTSVEKLKEFAEAWCNLAIEKAYEEDKKGE